MSTDHTPDARGPMKRWNVAGSTHARRRMAELRETKLRHEKRDLIREWERLTGWRAGSPTWWDEAQKAGLLPGCGAAASIAFLRNAIAALAETPDA